MQVSVIIVSYNTKELLDNCLKSVFEKSKDLNFEVLVVDNASSDGTKELIQAQWPQVRFLQNQVNLGFGAANNIGAELARGEHLFFLNSDTLLLNNAIKILSDHLIRYAHVGACGGNLYNANMQPATSFSQQMPGIQQEIHALSGEIIIRAKHKGNLYFNYGPRAIDIKGSVSGADFMIPRALFQELHGFDTDFFLYYEETELVYRIRKRGLLIQNIPQAKIIHLEGASQSIQETSLMHSFRSKYLYYEKTGQRKQIRLSHQLFQTRAWQRILIFSLIRNKSKAQYWKQLSRCENKSYLAWLT